MADTTMTPRPLAKPEIWRPKFLAELERTANVSASAKKAGVWRAAAYTARNESPEFAAAWDEALEVSLDALEQAGRARAKRQSDTLLMFFLKARRPHIYQSTLQVGGTGENGAIVIEHRDLPASVEALRELTLRLGLTLADVGPILSAPADADPDDSTGPSAP